MRHFDIIDEYVKKVCKEIRNKEAHKRVSEEIRSLILDMRDYYIQQGLDEVEATERAIEQTGKSMQLGEQFDKVHLPSPKWAMRPSLSLKTMLRTPIRTLITFLLLAAASFAMISRVAEYTIISREINRAAASYHGTVALDNGVPNNSYYAPFFAPPGASFFDGLYSYTAPTALTDEQLNAFESLPQVTSADRRYMTSGISMDNLLRDNLLDRSSTPHAEAFVIEGTYGGILPEQDHMPDHVKRLRFRDIKVLAGDPRMFITQMIALTANTEDTPIELYGIVTLYSQAFFESLVEGDRYLVVGRGSIIQPYYGGSLGVAYTDDFWPPVVSLEGLPENYLETDEFAPLRLLIDMTESARFTFDMVYTSDMSSILHFASDRLVISEGRALTAADEGTTHSVISNAIASAHNLNVGDTIAMGLGGKLLKQNSGLGAVPGIPERYSPPVKTVELTIVGIWADTATSSQRIWDIDWSYSQSTIFVPATLLPVDVPQDHQFFPGEYSLIIGNARDSFAFLQAAGPLADKLDVELLFEDGGWMRIEESIDTAQRLSLVTVALFLLAAAAAIMLAIHLYIISNKKTYAIMRAIGTPRSISRNSLFLPLGVIAAIAIPFGTVPGLIFTSHSAAPVLDTLADSVPGYNILPTLPAQTIALTLLCGIIFSVAAFMLYMRQMEKTSPLALLQGGKVRRKLVRKQRLLPVSDSIENIVFPVLMSESASSISLQLPPARHNAVFHVMSNIIRRMRRSLWKSVLVLMLTVLFCGAMGAMVLMRVSYEEVLDNVKIRGVLHYVASDAAKDAERSELFKDVYYKDAIPRNTPFNTMLINFIEESEIIITNDVARYVSDAGVDDFSITFWDDFNGVFMEYDIGIKLVVIGGDIARALDISPGDTILICHADEYIDNAYDWHEQYHGTPLDAESWMYERGKSGYTSWLNWINTMYTVVGIIDCDVYSRVVFTPVGWMPERIFMSVDWIRHDFYTVSYLEFLVADRERLDEALDFAESLRSRSTRLSANAALIMDTTEIENMVWTFELLNILFPFAIAASVFIGMLAPVLLLLQSTKDAAIMRSLGTTRRRTCIILALEQALLCLLGIMLTVGGLVIFDVNLFLQSCMMLAICLGLYAGGFALATITTVLIVTRHKVLYLLQTKE